VTDPRSPLSFRSDLARLKWLAVLLMTACHLLLTRDHPYNGIGLLVGAPVFPIFAGMIVIHLAADPERRCRRYLVSLAPAAVLAEIPYLLLNRGGVDWPRQVPLNALATFFCGVVLCTLAYRRRYLMLAGSLVPLVGLGLIGLDGWFTAPLAMLVAFVGLRRKLWTAPVVFAIVAIGLAINDLFEIPSFDVECHLAGLVLLPLIYFLGRVPCDLPPGPRLFFYAYYPGHLLIIWLLLGSYPPSAQADDPNRPLASIGHDEAIKQATDQLEALSGDEKARDVAVQFLAFYLINVKSRPAYCQKRGTDISAWTDAFVQANQTNYQKSRDILARSSFAPDQIEADLYRQWSSGFEKGIADAMATTATQLNLPEDQVCTVFARNDPAIGASMQLQLSNPVLSKALSDVR